ncbi:MAG TPA: M12 family metallopeptidase [Candidatus Tectomicrobia bacterium]|jgi:hypothetical protein
MVSNHRFVTCVLCLIFLGIVYTGKKTYAQLPSTLPEGYTIIEGDIIVSPLSDMPAAARAKFLARGPNLWPGGIVPFEFDANVDASDPNVGDPTLSRRARMRWAMQQWENVANVRFDQCQNDQCQGQQGSFAHIRDSTQDPCLGNPLQLCPTNFSEVGPQPSGKQLIIHIGSWNTPFIIAHELGHTLGIWHEQGRADRDYYIQVNDGTNGTPSNIQAGQGHNFENKSGIVYPKREYGLPDAKTYDFDSVMHYDQCSFSIDCPIGSSCACTNVVITVLAPNQAWQSQIGQRTHLSRLDQLTMSFLYADPDWRFVDRTYPGPEDGSFDQPYRTFIAGIQNTPVGSTLWLQPGSYTATGSYRNPVVLRAPLGHVTLGQ